MSAEICAGYVKLAPVRICSLLPWRHSGSLPVPEVRAVAGKLLRSPAATVLAAVGKLAGAHRPAELASCHIRGGLHGHWQQLTRK